MGQVHSLGVGPVGGGGSVDTANSPGAGEFAKFTDADTIEGRTVSETKSDLSLQNVTNESKATMFAGSAFTGTTTAQLIEVNSPTGGVKIKNRDAQDSFIQLYSPTGGKFAIYTDVGAQDRFTIDGTEAKFFVAPVVNSDNAYNASTWNGSLRLATENAVRDKIEALNQVFDIRDYGAAVDGTTNDSAAVLAAMTAAKDLGGGIIFFPKGITLINTETLLNVNASPDTSQYGVYIFQGVAGASILRFTQLQSGTVGLGIQNAYIAAFRDLIITGGVTGTLSSNTYEASFAGLYLTSNFFNIIERCQILGMSVSSTGGVVFASNGHFRMRDTAIGGSIATNTGVVTLDAVFSFELDTVIFIDGAAHDGISYGKTVPIGNTKNWLRTVNPAVNGGINIPTGIIRNSFFDENTTENLLNLTGTAEKSLLIENCGFNGGFLTTNTIKVDTFHRVEIKNTWVGYNAGPWSSLVADDVDNLIIDGLIHDAGATDIQLTGTTKRAKLRRCKDVTITNTAGAFIDADQAMPTTASAAALSPTGKVTHVTGTTNITSITTTNFKPGDELMLIFDGVLTVTNGNNLNLSGDFVTTADDMLVLVYDGTNFTEKSRTVVA